MFPKLPVTEVHLNVSTCSIRGAKASSTDFVRKSRSPFLRSLPPGSQSAATAIELARIRVNNLKRGRSCYPFKAHPGNGDRNCTTLQPQMSQPVPDEGRQDQQPEQEDFSWLPPHPPSQNKFLRKFKENPAVPIGECCWCIM